MRSLKVKGQRTKVAIADDMEEGEDSAVELEGKGQLNSASSQDFCMWDVKDHAMRSAAGVSELVSIADFKAMCARHLESIESGNITERVSSLPPGPVQDFGFTEMLDISIDELKAVREECNPEKLTPTQEIDSILKLRESTLPKDCPLQSIQNPKSVKSFLLLGSGPTLNRSNLRDNLPEQRSRRSQAVVRNRELESEVVITVLVFHPIRKRPDQEFHVLSSQPLTVLRDQIICRCDYFITHDFSEDLEAYETIYASNPAPPNPSTSAFFFIDNTFYSDLRHPQSSDKRVKEIISWNETRTCRDTSSHQDDFSQKDMAEVKFEQLTVHLGYPYLYNHHGNCEHLLVFADLRLYNPSIDKPVRSDYPVLAYKHKVKHRLCSVCNDQAVQWVTEDDDLAPESPCFFCKECFKKLHYTKDNKKLCNFKAYPYKASI